MKQILAAQHQANVAIVNSYGLILLDLDATISAQAKEIAALKEQVAERDARIAELLNPKTEAPE